ncbi:MAG: hypothetical protein JXB23_07215 [Candidatus Aminicenantes bacterium]|nr:hypothetical protein [Candidatus Aminicenantes bacterium]
MLRYVVIVSFIFTCTLLISLILRTFSFGKKKLYAVPQGDWKHGVAYAFGRGMTPWEKESAQKHLPTYFAGLIYHAGIFSGLFLLSSSIIAVPLSRLCLIFLQAFLALGIGCGFGLFIKRSVVGYMRWISCPDDFAANLLVDVFLGMALLYTFVPGLLAIFYSAAIVLFLYLPFGKIRHCLFFFYSRFLFGRFFGRRGAFFKKQT